MSDATADSGEALRDSDLAEAFLNYRDAGLTLPPVPAALAPAVEEVEDWLYATDGGDCIDADAFMIAAADPKASPAVAFGHVGHGMTSRFLCYGLVDGPVAILFRQRFGSPFSDRAAEIAAAGAAMEKVEWLLSLTALAEADGRLQAGQRLVVVADAGGRSGWQLLGQDGTAWLDNPAPFDQAIEVLGGRKAPS
jgi:hypothetical protein